MAKPRFYDTSSIKLKLGSVVERINGEETGGIHTITGVRMKKANNGITSYEYQLDEDDNNWVRAGFIRLFVDPNTVNNIALWLKDNLNDYIKVVSTAEGESEAAWATDLLDDLQKTFIPKDED